jgi:hypothetical protein
MHVFTHTQIHTIYIYICMYFVITAEQVYVCMRVIVLLHMSVCIHACMHAQLYTYVNCRTSMTGCMHNVDMYMDVCMCTALGAFVRMYARMSLYKAQ